MYPSPQAFVPLMPLSLCSPQSDREKSEGLPVAPFMDRDKVTKATAQIGFIKFVLIPMFETVTKVRDCAGGTAAVNTHVHTCMHVHFGDMHCVYTCIHMHTYEPSTASSAVMVMVAWQPFLLLCPVPPPLVLFKELHVWLPNPLCPLCPCLSLPALRPSQLYQLLAFLSFQASP